MEAGRGEVGLGWERDAYRGEMAAAEEEGSAGPRR
jgi:hypothetical protein